jgi:hypothetical protein
MTANQPEAFSRILIDKALEFSGWDLLDLTQVQFELHTSGGRTDYLLKDKLGRVLCVLEAKREDLDPYDAKEQARGYAENLTAPFVILSNGREHWFWNYERADQGDAYRIERLPSREDLERLRLKNLQPPRPLGSEVIKPDHLRHLTPSTRSLPTRTPTDTSVAPKAMMWLQATRRRPPPAGRRRADGSFAQDKKGDRQAIAVEPGDQFRIVELASSGGTY